MRNLCSYNDSFQNTVNMCPTAVNSYINFVRLYFPCDTDKQESVLLG